MSERTINLQFIPQKAASIHYQSLFEEHNFAYQQFSELFFLVMMMLYIVFAHHRNGTD